MTVHTEIPISTVKHVFFYIDKDGNLIRENRDIKMLKLIPNDTPKNLKVLFLIDKSGSMAPISKDVVKSLNAQLESIRENSKKNGLYTEVSVRTFNNNCAEDISFTDINSFKGIDTGSFSCCGNTALFDAVWTVGDAFDRKDFLYQLILITDGEENSSRFCDKWTFIEKIRTFTKNENLTLIAWVPPHSKHTLSNLGWPAGNITEWEGTKDSVERTTVATLSSNNSLFDNYSKGVTRSVSYFTPDLNVSPTLVQANLDDVTDKYKRIFVGPAHCGQIRTVFSSLANKPYRAGKCFYQLKNKVTLQSYKDIVLYELRTSKMFSGDKVRTLLRIPEGGSIELNPATSTDYQIFIRSTSWNRNIASNTYILEEL